MDFDLSEEQRLLKESIDGLLTDSYDFDARKKYQKEKGGWSKAVWGKLAEQGLLGLPFAEADGGFGAGAVETMIVMEALGKALVLEPYLATVVIGGGFLRHGGSAEQKAAHIPGIIDGSKTFAFAQLEKNSRYDLGDVSTTAKKKGAGWVIDGEKFVVLNGENADTLIVTARTKGAQRDKTGIGVFLVPANAKGVTRKGYPTQDGLHAADITLTGVEVGADAAIGDPENGLPLIERVVDEARTAMCAEAVGAMDESLKSTVEYLKTRKQFGVRSAPSRPCSTAPPTCSWRSNRPAACRCSRPWRPISTAPRSAPPRSPPPRCRSASPASSSASSRSSFTAASA